MAGIFGVGGSNGTISGSNRPEIVSMTWHDIDMDKSPAMSLFAKLLWPWLTDPHLVWSESELLNAKLWRHNNYDLIIVL